MELYEELKNVYKKYFVNNPDFLSMELIQVSEDIPTKTEGFRKLITIAYQFLSSSSSRDAGHLKVLVNWDRLMKKNRDKGMNTSPIVFATMLYLLHHYCVRILRSPWRKDFFVIKDYNGFYQYTLRQNLSPSIIEELLHYMGFQYKRDLCMFMLTFNTLNRQAIDSITDSGIGFFLSYAHCMFANDSHFKRRVMPNYSRNPTPSLTQSHTSERQSTSRINELRNGARELDSSTYSQAGTSSSRERRRDKRAKETETRNLYGSDLRTQNRSGYYSSGSAASNSMANIYDSNEVPLDLSSKTPYGHRVNRNSGDRHAESPGRGSPHSDYMDDQALYGGESDSRHSATFNGNNDRDLSPENSLNGRVLYPPNTTRQSASSLGAQMENIRFDEESRPKDYALKTATEFKHPPNQAASLSANYVKFYPRRGSPDGEMTSEGYYDHQYAPDRQHKSSRTQPRNSRTRNHHVYHKIDDNLY